MSKRQCPHVGNDRFGDEQEWCVVCLKNEVERLQDELGRQDAEIIVLNAALRDVAERQREACALSLCDKVPHSSCPEMTCPAAHVWLTPLVDHA